MDHQEEISPFRRSVSSSSSYCYAHILSVTGLLHLLLEAHLSRMRFPPPAFETAQIIFHPSPIFSGVEFLLILPRRRIFLPLDPSRGRQERRPPPPTRSSIGQHSCGREHYTFLVEAYVLIPPSPLLSNE